MAIPRTRRYDRESIEDLIRQQADSGELSRERLKLAAWLGDPLAAELTGLEEPAPRAFGAFWPALRAGFGGDACVRALVTVAGHILAKKKKHGSPDAEAAHAAAARWVAKPTPATSEAARDVALEQMDRYSVPAYDGQTALASLCMHAAWSAGIHPRLSLTNAEWTGLVGRVATATRTGTTTLRKVVVDELLPWALGLDETAYAIYSKGGKKKKAKAKKKKKKKKTKAKAKKKKKTKKKK